MKRYDRRAICLLFLLFVFFSCEKSDQGPVLNPDQFEFGIVGELFPGIKNEYDKSIQIIIPQESDKRQLRAYFKTPDHTELFINNSLQISWETILDYSQPMTLQLRSNGKYISSSWTISVQKETEAYGLGKYLIAARSLNKSWDFYVDQYQTGFYAVNNCGPAVVAMASKWVDSSFVQSVSELRASIRPDGSLWSTSDIMQSLKTQSIHADIVYLGQIENVIRKEIDAGSILILCLDMYDIKQNTNRIEKRGKFYTNTSRGYGHFILVKGYQIVDDKFYLEVYDPNSGGKVYSLNQEPRGKDRYYAAKEVQLATENWWNYAIVVSPKN